MIELSTFTFLALLEVLMAMAIVIGFLLWQKRKPAKIPDHDVVEVPIPEPAGPTPSLYLERESAKTKDFVASLQEDPRAEPTDLVLRAALSLRAGLLRKEYELAQAPVDARDAELWTALAEKVKAELDADAFSHGSAKSHAVHGEDTASIEVIAAQQTRTIQYLRDYVEQLLEKIGHQPIPDSNITDRFDQIERANREMSQCITVLEDENSFLRDQIAALLKTD